jgi:DNA-binding XRE family transcriptional regulator
MAKRIAKRIRRDFTPEEKSRWKKALAETEADREQILAHGRSLLAARRKARELFEELKQERQRRGLSLADMMRLTGMSRASISRLENDETPNPTMRTISRYADALGMEFQFDVRPRKGA